MPSFENAFMEFTFVVTMGGVHLIYIAVAGFQKTDYAGLVDCAGADVVGQRSEKDTVFPILGVEGAELSEVFAQQDVGLGFGQLTAFAIWLSWEDAMPISYIRPVARFMQCFKVLDDYYGSLK